MSEVVARIIAHYPNPRLELEYSNAFELLVALVLSARCTDKTTNAITKKLFAKYKLPKDIINAGTQEIDEVIKSCSMHTTKAKHIYEISKVLCEKYNCEVPTKKDDLVSLPGVGAKTANIVLAFAFDIPAIGVDTHVARVIKRLGISEKEDSQIVEEAIKKICTTKNYKAFFAGLILHGRYICKAKKPDCKHCFLSDICAKNI